MWLYASPYGCSEVRYFLLRQPGARHFLMGEHSRWQEADDTDEGYCAEPHTYAVEVHSEEDVRRVFKELLNWAVNRRWEPGGESPPLPERRELALAALREGATHHALRFDAIRRGGVTYPPPDYTHYEGVYDPETHSYVSAEDAEDLAEE